MPFHFQPKWGIFQLPPLQSWTGTQLPPFPTPSQPIPTPSATVCHMMAILRDSVPAALFPGRKQAALPLLPSSFLLLLVRHLLLVAWHLLLVASCYY